MVICILIFLFLISGFLGTLWHPWETIVEESGISLLNMEKLKNDAEEEDIQSENLTDRIDVIKNNIYNLCFSDSSSGILYFAANKLLSPVTNTAQSIVLAAAYTGMSNQYQNRSPNLMYLLFIVIGYFFLFYLFQFGTGRVIQWIEDSCSSNIVSKAEKMIISYCVDGILSVAFLIASYLMMLFFSSFRDIGAFSVFDGALSSGSAFIVIPAAAFIIAACLFFFVLIFGMIICTGPYLFLMALPVVLTAWLSAWVWMPLRMAVCFGLEILAIGYVFPHLHEHLNLWNTVKKILQILFGIIRFIFHPIRTIRMLITGSEW